MKTVEFELGGQTYHLLLNAAALFDAYDYFGDTGDLLDRIAGTGRESFDNTCWMLVKLAQQGEAWRRYMGQEAQPMLTAAQAQRATTPQDILRAKAAIREAYALAFARTARSEEEDIDLGLLELQKKTGPASPGQSGFSGLRSFLASAFRTP